MSCFWSRFNSFFTFSQYENGIDHGALTQYGLAASMRHMVNNSLAVVAISLIKIGKSCTISSVVVMQPSVLEPVTLASRIRAFYASLFRTEVEVWQFA